MTARGRARVVLFAHRLSLPTPTGVGRYVAQLTRAIDADESAGFADYTLCSAPEPAPLAWQPAHLAVRRLPGPRRALHLAWAMAGRPRIERLTGGGDLVHVLDPSLPVPTGLPSVWTIHDLMPLQFPEWFPAAHRWAFAKGTHAAADRGSVLVAVSDHVASDIQSLLQVDAARIEVIPPGVAPAFAAPITDAARQAACARHGVEPGRFLIAVGTVSARKNLAPVIGAVATLGDATLLLAGPEGDDAGPVRAQVERLGIADRVRTAGYVAEADLAPLVSSATALVHPSRYEGFGLPPAEAMAAGTPVIASRAGSLPEVVGDAGLLLDPDDSDEWAAAMASVRDDAGVSERLRDAGRRRAARYDWRTTAARIIALHRSLLER